LKSLLEEIKKNVKPFTDGKHSIIPVPSEGPREIPRIILSSRDGSVKSTLSFEKVSITWTNLKESENFNIPIDDLKNITEELAKTILTHTGSKTVKRIGYIKELFFIKDPTKTFSELFTKSKTNLRDYVFQLTYDSNLLKVKGNRVIVIGSGSKQTGDKDRVVMMSSDINTHQSEDVGWGIQDIKEFIEKADEKTNKNDFYGVYFETR